MATHPAALTHPPGCRSTACAGAQPACAGAPAQAEAQGGGQAEGGHGGAQALLPPPRHCPCCRHCHQTPTLQTADGAVLARALRRHAPRGHADHHAQGASRAPASCLLSAAALLIAQARHSSMAALVVRSGGGTLTTPDLAQAHCAGEKPLGKPVLMARAEALGTATVSIYGRPHIP